MTRKLLQTKLGRICRGPLQFKFCVTIQTHHVHRSENPLLLRVHFPQVDLWIKYNSSLDSSKHLHWNWETNTETGMEMQKTSNRQKNCKTLLYIAKQISIFIISTQSLIICCCFLLQWQLKSHLAYISHAIQFFKPTVFIKSLDLFSPRLLFCILWLTSHLYIPCNHCFFCVFYSFYIQVRLCYFFLCLSLKHTIPQPYYSKWDILFLFRAE